MRRTGYVRPWHRASKNGLTQGPIYWLMRMTIGSRVNPIDVMARYKEISLSRERV